MSNISSSIIIFKGLYVIDTTSQVYVEECIVWEEKETLIVSYSLFKQGFTQNLEAASMYQLRGQYPNRQIVQFLKNEVLV